MTKRLGCIVALTTVIVSSLHAEIELPEIFSDNMVLQRNTAAHMWGWSSPDSRITVRTDWNDSIFSTQSDEEGKWDIRIDTPEGGYATRKIVVSGDNSEITLENVLIGDVWFCSGQSNMEMPLRGFGSSPVEGAAETIAYSGRNKGVRVATVPLTQSYEVQDRVPGKWMISSPENAGGFSAVGYYFAEALNRITDVPIGIVVCAYGGSKLESWLPEWKVREYGDKYDVALEKKLTDEETKRWERMVVDYNAMLHPLIGLSIKGFLWNQGEANVGMHEDYAQHLKDLVELWRSEWGQGDLPFYFVEIPGWSYGYPDGTVAAMLRESQHEAAKMIPNCEIVSTADLTYPYEVNEIHARQKRPIGERLAFVAAAKDYGVKGVPNEYPTFEKISVDGNKAVVYFTQPNQGLNPASELQGFEVAGEDRRFYPVIATCDWDFDENRFKINITSDDVGDIKSVRYGFRNFYPARVKDSMGMPLVPFRTDSWEK